MQKKLLIFDSGLGGLSILNEIVSMGLDIEIDYLADNEFFPYGEKSDLELLERIPEIIKKAASKTKADAVIIACNTASTIALYRIRQVCDIPIIGVVPAIKPACLLSKTKTIGVLATPRTIGSAYFDQLIEDFGNNCRVLRYGPPMLARAAEDFLLNGKIDEEAIKDAINGLVSQNGGNDIDIIVLACTHYPFLREELGRQLKRPIDWIDSGNAIARRVKELLDLKGNNNCKLGQFIITGEIFDIHRNLAAKFNFSKIINI